MAPMMANATSLAVTPDADPLDGDRHRLRSHLGKGLCGEHVLD